MNSSTALSVRIHQVGGPEVLQFESLQLPMPSAGQARVRQHAVGLNFIDVYHRTGLYPLPLPCGLGQEAAGVVEAVGEGVTEVAVGDRVAYAGGDAGAYCDLRNMPAQRLIKLPDDISLELAAAMLLQGMTVQYLLRQTYAVKAGDVVLIHAAAGGVGQIACQWAKHLGATVIGTVGSRAKAAVAAANGCDHPVIYTEENFAERARDITGGRGVDVVYDSIGKDTFMASLSTLRPLGMMVSFGNASGPAPAVEPALLSRLGSLFLTRPTLAHYTATRSALLQCAQELFEVVRSGAVRINIGQRYALSEVQRAHRELEARSTTGSSILIPDGITQ